MPKLILAAGVVILLATPSPSAEPSKPIKKETVLKAIAAFRENPFSDLSRGCRGIILQFAEDSPEVQVRISPKTVPFLNSKSGDQDDRATLLAAFVAGNVDSQLLRNQKKDDSYAGVLQVIETYRQLRQRHPKLQLAEVEKFIELEKQGKLKTYVSAAP